MLKGGDRVKILDCPEERHVGKFGKVVSVTLGPKALIQPPDGSRMKLRNVFQYIVKLDGGEVTARPARIPTPENLIHDWFIHGCRGDWPVALFYYHRHCEEIRLWRTDAAISASRCPPHIDRFMQDMKRRFSVGASA